MNTSYLRLSLIVCTYQRPREVEQLLKSLKSQTLSPDEILVIDASPNNDTQDTVAPIGRQEFIKGLSYVKAGPNDRGLTRQRNLGISLAKGDIIAFLDDDTIPSPTYFEEIVNCYERNPSAIGVGGYVDEAGLWFRNERGARLSRSNFHLEGWERPQGFRFVLREILGLAYPLPGIIPEWGHGRSNGFVPPDGRDHRVDCLIGCAASFRRTVFEKESFSKYFEGYGLYEDLDFSVRAMRHGDLVLCTQALVNHYHSPSGRPNHVRYGIMVVRNGWYVWRVQWPNPSTKARFKWWAVTLLLTVLRLIDFRPSAIRKAIPEGAGRVFGLLSLIFLAPKHDEKDYVIHKI